MSRFGYSASFHALRTEADRGCETCKTLCNGILGLIQLQQATCSQKQALNGSGEGPKKSWAETWLEARASDFILRYGGDPMYEHPHHLAAWSLRSPRRLGGKDRFNFDIFCLPGVFHGV